MEDAVVSRRKVPVSGSPGSEGGDKGDGITSLLPNISIPEINLEEKFERIAHWAWSTVPYHKLPHYLRDNEFLKRYHRPVMNSFRGCTKSMFRMHTETWNIWTHLLGFIFFLFLCGGAYVYGDCITHYFEDIHIRSLPLDGQLMLLFFFVSAMTCLSCSCMFHLFSNHSHGMYHLFSKLDYSGIAVLITGSSIPAYYYGFYCTDFAKYTHITILTLLCIGCVCVSMGNKFGSPKYRPLRFAVFVLFGLYGVFPAGHILLREGYPVATTDYPAWGILIMAGLYIGGAALYVLRIPERFSPGRFDIWASSHQLFHVCVVTAALVHYDSLLSMVKYRLDVGACLPLEMIIA